MNRDAERDDATGRTPRSGRVGSNYHHEKIVAKFEKKGVNALLLLRCLIRPTYPEAREARSFLFSRVDLLNRTDPAEAVRNVEYMM